MKLNRISWVQSILITTLLLGAAARAEFVSFPFSPSSSLELVSLLSPEFDSLKSARCHVEVDRPALEEGPSGPSKKNKVICDAVLGFKGNPTQTFIYRMYKSSIEAWGTHFEKYHFSISGQTADDLFEKFREKTRNLPESTPANSSWSKLVLCGPDGDHCIASYLLSTRPGPDSPAQISCGQETDLVRASTVSVQDSGFSSHAGYLEEMIRLQIEAGDRVIKRTNCIVQK